MTRYTQYHPSVGQILQSKWYAFADAMHYFVPVVHWTVIVALVVIMLMVAPSLWEEVQFKFRDPKLYKLRVAGLVSAGHRKEAGMTYHTMCATQYWDEHGLIFRRWWFKASVNLLVVDWLFAKLFG